ncbi:xanthine dehydrogenase family protein subunit M [Acrocarpospora macrocephala]|uniref:FAD-binding molybdopterin dehydrogenase n=1 Tax=Acrocarpospora macrocephala TaxID=150177 RepID=A0A5M3WXR2_9ACTN|nr:xanthine dehydrogenase family protein subunit M [Acrocarpospora macrocephala]GES13052.1 FAD-binding molybdopterin dehydrogenase [Acrocarpospora macrocephala]
MKAFEYARAADPADAVARFRPGAMYLGGGTNLVDLMRLGVAEPGALVDVSRLPLGGVEPDGDGLRIGAAVRNSELAAHPLVRERYPVLARAVLAGASGQVRNMATVAGNLLQRTRCPYFQDVSKPCNKRQPGSGCPAIGGDHANLAVLGHSRACVATHPSDMAVALAALDARVHITGPGGDRVLAMPGLHRLPGDEPHRDTRLEPGELITAVALPAPPPGASHYRKVRERASFAFALVSIAAVLDVGADGTVADCRIALGGVAHVPWRAFHAEQALRGSRAGEDAFVRAAEAEMAEAVPLPRNAYKVPLARNLIVRTLLELAP